ncbi:MAG: hypothetical protein JWN22_1720 [Nocardioides sp.]|jgi:hypothetical protein|nr:hypothetical protein [Nocardioides sp.]
MPMPPPKPSTEGPRDRQVVQEMYQIVRALEANGPLQPGELGRLVGADYWERGRFDKAVVLAVSDGLVHRTGDGALASS